MTPKNTRILMGAAAVATAGLIWFGPSPDGDVVTSEPAKTGSAPRVRAVQPANSLATAGAALDQRLALNEERDRLTQKPASNLFGQSTWVKPPPPPPRTPPAPVTPPPPPPPPSAPALPFAFMGKFDQGDTHVVFLTRGNRVITATQGETLDNTYRIDRIEATKVLFTYLPMGVSQSLATGGSQ